MSINQGRKNNTSFAVMINLCGLLVLVSTACAQWHKCGDQGLTQHVIFEPFDGAKADQLKKDTNPISEARMAEVLKTATLTLCQGGWEGGDDWVVIEPSGLVRMDYAFRGAMSGAPFRRTVAQLTPDGLARIRKQFLARHFQDWPVESIATNVADGTQSYVSVVGDGFTKRSDWSNTCTVDMAGLFADVEQVVLDENLAKVTSTEDYNEFPFKRDRPDSKSTHPGTQPAATQPATQPMTTQPAMQQSAKQPSTDQK